LLTHDSMLQAPAGKMPWRTRVIRAPERERGKREDDRAPTNRMPSSFGVNAFDRPRCLCYDFFDI
jgi:hypothetical protein